jgi:NADH:ubiquinone oxidoreductase subunit 2 (subunit N)
MIEHINKLFMAVVALSLFTYFERPDYNLPLFAFIILLWDNAYVKQKTRIWYLMAVSLLVDLIWIIYWAVTWGGYNNKEAGLCNFTIFMSVLIFILKLVILILTFVKVDDCKKAISELGANVKYVFKGPQTGGY